MVTLLPRISGYPYLRRPAYDPDATTRWPTWLIPERVLPSGEAVPML